MVDTRAEELAREIEQGIERIERNPNSPELYRELHYFLKRAISQLENVRRVGFPNILGRISGELEKYRIQRFTGLLKDQFYVEAVDKHPWEDNLGVRITVGRLIGIYQGELYNARAPPYENRRAVVKLN